MAYDKHTWTCDEPITVERLNHIEDGIANAGGGECGFECDEEIVTLTEETVTTTAQGEMIVSDLSYSQFINAETIRVTFDGVEYECPRIAHSSSQNLYGGVDPATLMPDFSQYPFAISSYNSGSDVGGRGDTRDIDPAPNQLVTQTAGTYTIKITAMGMTVTTTQCFEDAVNSVIDKIDCATVPIQACTPTLINLTPPSPAVTIYANSGSSLRFSAGDRLSMYAVIRSINLPSGLVIRGYLVQDHYVTLFVRNDTDNDISVSSADVSMQVVDFASSNKVCVMLGTNCDGPDPK